METNIKILESENGSVKLEETKIYTLTADEVRREKENISWRKKDLISRSQAIKKEFDELSTREKKLQNALEKIDGDESTLELLG